MDTYALTIWNIWNGCHFKAIQSITALRGLIASLNNVKRDNWVPTFQNFLYICSILQLNEQTATDNFPQCRVSTHFFPVSEIAIVHLSKCAGSRIDDIVCNMVSYIHSGSVNIKINDKVRWMYSGNFWNGNAVA